MLDVAVIGGGVAGAAAALAAAAQGARVAVIRAAPGATALAGGGWYDEPPAALIAALAAAGHELAPAAHALPHPIGELIRCSHAHVPHLGAYVEAGACVVGIAGLPSFRARALATLWGDAAGVTLTHATLTLDTTLPAGWAPAALAAALEREPDLLARALASELRGRDVTAVLLPAVLGVDDVESVRHAAQDAAGVPVAEALGVPPSLPGWRLQRALDRALAAAGIAVLAGRAGAPERAGADLAAVAVTDSAGGAAGPEWREPTLGAALRLDRHGTRFAAIEPLATTSLDRTAAQPPLAVGVRCDEAGRPFGEDGGPLYANVHAAGAVRDGHFTDWPLGSAARDGWRAGIAAARAAAAELAS